MLRVDGSLDHIPARRGHVVSLYESINQPLVNIPGYGAAPTGAFILGTRNDHGAFTVFVYLYQPQTQAVLIYVSEPRSLTAEQLRKEESEAVRFVESMGFMVDDVQFGQLGPSEQEAVMERVPMFRPLAAREVVEGRPTSEARFGALGGVVTGRAEQAPAMNPLSRPGGVEGGIPAQPLPSGLPVEAASRTDGVKGGFAGGLGDASLADGLSPDASGGPKGSRPGSSRVEAEASVSPPEGDELDFVQTPSPNPTLPLGRGLPAAPQGGAEPRSGVTSSMTADSLARIGRLLGTFSVIAALIQGASACATNSAAKSKEIQAEVGLGNRELEMHRWPEALRHFQVALNLDDSEKNAHLGAGLAYFQLGRLETAERHLRRAVEEDKGWSEAKNSLAVVLASQERCGEAQVLLRQVTEDVFYPSRHIAEHNLARAEACSGDAKKALERLQRLTEKKPKFCKAYLTASEIAEKAEFHESTVEACESFRDFCERDENIGTRIPELVALCQLRKGRAYVALGDVESARTAFERCGSAEVTRTTCRDALNLLPP